MPQPGYFFVVVDCTRRHCGSEILLRYRLRSMFTGVDVMGSSHALLLPCGFRVKKEFGRAVDTFAKVLGFIMIVLTLYVAVVAAPPLGEVAPKLCTWHNWLDNHHHISGGTGGGLSRLLVATACSTPGVKGQREFKVKLVEVRHCL